MENITATDIRDFQAEVFCITGSVPGFCRDDLWQHIQARDGEFTNRINRTVTILVYGVRVGSKYQQALDRGIHTMHWRDFLQLLARTPVIDPDAHLRPLHMGSARRYLGGAHVTPPVPHPAPATVVPLHAEPSDPEYVVTHIYEPEPVCNTAALPERPRKSRMHVVRHILSGALTVLLALARVVVAVAAVALCIVFWLVGIPARP